MCLKVGHDDRNASQSRLQWPQRSLSVPERRQLAFLVLRTPNAIGNRPRRPQSYLFLPSPPRDDYEPKRRVFARATPPSTRDGASSSPTILVSTRTSSGICNISREALVLAPMTLYSDNLRSLVQRLRSNLGRPRQYQLSVLGHPHKDPSGQELTNPSRETTPVALPPMQAPDIVMSSSREVKTLSHVIRFSPHPTAHPQKTGDSHFFIVEENWAPTAPFSSTVNPLDASPVHRRYAAYIQRGSPRLDFSDRASQADSTRCNGNTGHIRAGSRIVEAESQRHFKLRTVFAGFRGDTHSTGDRLTSLLSTLIAHQTPHLRDERSSRLFELRTVCNRSTVARTPPSRGDVRGRTQGDLVKISSAETGARGGGATYARTLAAGQTLGDSIRTRGDMCDTSGPAATSVSARNKAYREFDSSDCARAAQNFAAYAGVQYDFDSRHKRFMLHNCVHDKNGSALPGVLPSDTFQVQAYQYQLRRVQFLRSLRNRCVSAQDVHSGSVRSGKSRTKTNTKLVVTIAAPRRRQRQAQGAGSVAWFDNSVSKIRKYMHGKSDFALQEGQTWQSTRADVLANEPHLRRPPRRVNALAKTSRVTDCVYQFCGDVRSVCGPTQSRATPSVKRSTSPTFSDSAICVRAPVAQLELGDGIEYSPQRLQKPRRHYRKSDRKSDSSDNASSARTFADRPGVQTDSRHREQRVQVPQARAQQERLSRIKNARSRWRCKRMSSGDPPMMRMASGTGCIKYSSRTARALARQLHQARTRAPYFEDDRYRPPRHKPSKSLRAPMTEDSQDLSWERIIRLLFPRTAPAARTFPRFGRFGSLPFCPIPLALRSHLVALWTWF
ncbi:hypothetical protein EDB84DRAFT_1443457 [Lactarius hengduanensis]|nr:hypothetical protein EDB84DRAFT_1443457 [Lactarius hengduanensis]